MPVYSKTNWVDGSVPAIDATNLNKIEQGIFDSLRQDGSTTMSGQLVTTAGSAATPAIAPTGDSNTGIFFPAADTIAFGEGGGEAMRINSSGNVGIGTTSPAGRLTLRGASGTSGKNQGILIEYSNGTEFGAFGLNDSTGWPQLMARAGAGLTFHTNSDLLTSGEAMRITSAGNVGIGTTNPTTRLQVDDTYGGYRAGIVIKNTADGATGRGTGIEWHSGTGTTKGEIALTAIDASQDGYDMKFLTTATGGSKTTKMTITGAGNVGIGTTSPSGKLEVSDSIGSNTGLYSYITNTNAGGYSVLSIRNTGTSGREWHVGVGGNTVSNLALGGKFYIYDNTATSVRMTIDSNGKFGLGTVSPQGQLHIKNNIDLEFYADNATGCSILSYNRTSSIFTELDLRASAIKFLVSDVDKGRFDTNGYFLVGYTSSNGAYPLQVNGQIFATSSTIATSDGKYKKDIVALDGALDIVKALNPVQFSWKDHPVHKFNTDVPTVGFIAQEVEQALADKSYLTSIIKKSECTWEEETGEFVDVINQVEVDGELVDEIVQEPVKITHTEEFLGIAESNLIAILTQAVKELTAKVEALEAQLNK